jgi:ribonuclease-3
MTAGHRSSVEQSLGHNFADAALLIQALTHRSFGAENNERLEFLGDSVLNCVIGTMLYRRFPALREGQLSRLRANLVNQQPLFEIASELDLGKHLRLGEGELRSGGATRPSILADALESLFGAVLLDAGFDRASAVIEHLFSQRMADIDPDKHGKDAKTLLQEWLQSRRHGLPAYELLGATGQAHAQTFRVACRIDALNLRTEGSGNSRKAAEQMAAEYAYQRLNAP